MSLAANETTAEVTSKGVMETIRITEDEGYTAELSSGERVVEYLFVQPKNAVASHCGKRMLGGWICSHIVTSLSWGYSFGIDLRIPSALLHSNKFFLRIAILPAGFYGRFTPITGRNTGDIHDKRTVYKKHITKKKSSTIQLTEDKQKQ